MTNTTPKTILLASLIAVMILPISNISSTQAVSSDDESVETFNADEARSILASKLSQAIEDKSTSKHTRDSTGIDRTLERIDIFSQLVDIKETIDSETDHKEIKKLNMKAERLISKYHRTIQSEEIELGTDYVESTSKTTDLSNPIAFSTTQTRNADCNNPNKTWGYQTGNGQSYPTHIVTDNWSSYPSSVGDGGGLEGCITFDGEYIHNKLSTLDATCWHYMWPVSGNFYNMQCNTIQMLDVVLVENQAWYSGGNMFNAANGWTIMLT